MPEPSILISAGEASGEMYGAQLVEALHRRDPQLEFFGVGGDRMRAAGCVISTTEMIMYELLRRSGTPEFKEILQYVK